VSQHFPDPRLHQQISFLKSGLRILAGAVMIAGGITASVANALMISGLFLILAEFLGVAEELV